MTDSKLTQISIHELSYFLLENQKEFKLRFKFNEIIQLPIIKKIKNEKIYALIEGIQNFFNTTIGNYCKDDIKADFLIFHDNYFHI